MVYDKKSVVILNSERLPRDKQDRNNQVVSFIMECLELYKTARGDLEDIWLESWAAYAGSSTAVEFQRTLTAEIVGDINDDWRHKVNVGKAYEIVETVVAYLSAAIFPNKDWLKIEPLSPIHRMLARVLTKYFADKMEEWRFKSQFISSLRQAAITGTTTISIQWVDGEVRFETLDNFDVYYDPVAITAEESAVIKRVMLKRADIIKKINSGEFEHITIEDVQKLGAYSISDTEDNIEIVRDFYGLDGNESISYSDQIECWEFWGDIILDGVMYINHYAVVIGDHLVKFAESPYNCGRPMVAGTYTPVVRQPHGMSSFQAALGLLHVLNCVSNQRLDNVELGTNVMFKRKQSSITPAEDCYVEPGKVFDVIEMDELMPFTPDVSSLVINYQEAATITAAVEQTTGTGPLVSTGQPRGGERVTAKEVSMVREAGSNRLSVVHNHIEETFLIPVLQKVLSIVRQFVSTDSIVRISGARRDSNEYYAVGRTELRNTDIRLKPRSAGHIVEQQAYIEKRTAFIQLVLSVPQFAEKIDFERLLIDLLENWGFEDPMSYMITEQQAAEGGTTDMMGKLESMGGKGLRSAATQELAIDGGNSALQNIAGIKLPEGVRLDELLSNVAAIEPGVTGFDPGTGGTLEQ